MPIKIQPLSKSQLVQLFKDYRGSFPEWDVEHEVTLVRSSGSVKQVIAFEALRSGAYRPSHSIHVAGPPDGGQLLFQHLDVRHREILPRDHATKWPLVVDAMEKQFLPSIRKPLYPAEILQLAKEQVARDGINKSRTFTSLAVLASHLGHIDEAIGWCHRSDARLANMGRELVDWELRLVSFNRQLEYTLEHGKDL